MVANTEVWTHVLQLKEGLRISGTVAFRVFCFLYLLYFFFFIITLNVCGETALSGLGV